MVARTGESGAVRMSERWRRGACLVAVAVVGLTGGARAQLVGELGAHDPSTLSKVGDRFYYFATGPGIVSRRSGDMTSWSAGPSVFASPPAWTTGAVPGFDGTFWAPDVMYRNNQYYLYYSVSTWGSKTSAIGLATSPTLDPAAPNYGWTDRGVVIQSGNSTNYNAIDPSVMQDAATGRVWMAYGSYWNGIYVAELDPVSGKRLGGAPLVHVAAPGPTPAIEAAALIKKGGYYYLLVNWGSCCAGVDSTYEIRMGRSTSPTGPFLDKNGVNLLSGGGSLFLDDDGRRTGPGHFSLSSEAGQDYFGYHYYDGDRNGARTYGLRTLHWTADAWPSAAAVSPNWTATGNVNWSSAANWSGGVVPDGVGHVANFGALSANRYVAAVDGVGRTVGTINFTGNAGYTVGTTNGNSLTLDAMAGDSATINVAAGSHTVAAPLVAKDHLGVHVAQAAGTLSVIGSVSAPAMTKYGRGALELGGANAYAGSVLVRAGTLRVAGSVTANQYSSVGPNTGDNATVVLAGSGSFTANADLNVGDTGDGGTAATGTLEIRDNAAVTVNSPGGFFVGSGFFANTRAAGTVNQAGGTLTVQNGSEGSFVIGGRNSSLGVGTYNLAGGVVSAETSVYVGGRGSGSVAQTGGSFGSTGNVSIGRFSTAMGTWTISAGTLHQINAGRMLIVGEAGTGTLSVSGTGEVVAAGPLRIGALGMGVGTVNLDGGVITAPSVGRGVGAGRFNFNGGTLRAGAGGAAFMQGLTSAVVRGGGAVVDTQAFDVTIAQPLLHDPALGPTSDGGLTKGGAGILRLTGAGTYTGRTVVTAGTLVLSPAAWGPVLSLGGAEVVGGAWLVFEYLPASSPVDEVADAIAAGEIRAGALPSGHALAYSDDGGAVTVFGALAGDANLDGALNADDYALLDRGLASGGTYWWEGDFNHDRVVGPGDYLVLDSAFARRQGGYVPSGLLATREAQFGRAYVVALVASVPEPSIAWLAVCAAASVRYRKGGRASMIAWAWRRRRKSGGSTSGRSFA